MDYGGEKKQIHLDLTQELARLGRRETSYLLEKLIK